MSISGKVGSRAVGYYMATTVMAVILGKFSFFGLFINYVTNSQKVAQMAKKYQIS